MICGCAETSAKRDVKKIEKVCYANDYEKAHLILSKLRQNAIGDRDFRKYYLSALETVYTSELTYIVLNYPENAELRIRVLMNEIQTFGTRPSSDAMDVSVSESYSYRDYQKWLLSYNTICRKLLDLAIGIKSQNLAKLAVSLTKENLEVYDGFLGCGIKVVYTDRESITSKYEDAVNSGLFE